MGASTQLRESDVLSIGLFLGGCLTRYRTFMQTGCRARNALAPSAVRLGERIVRSDGTVTGKHASRTNVYLDMRGAHVSPTREQGSPLLARRAILPSRRPASGTPA